MDLVSWRTQTRTDPRQDKTDPILLPFSLPSISFSLISPLDLYNHKWESKVSFQG